MSRIVIIGAGVAGLSRYHPEARQRAEASGPA